jgi:hypothetical protein
LLSLLNTKTAHARYPRHRTQHLARFGIEIEMPARVLMKGLGLVDLTHVCSLARRLPRPVDRVMLRWLNANEPEVRAKGLIATSANLAGAQMGGVFSLAPLGRATVAGMVAHEDSYRMEVKNPTPWTGRTRTIRNARSVAEAFDVKELLHDPRVPFQARDAPSIHLHASRAGANAHAIGPQLNAWILLELLHRMPAKTVLSGLPIADGRPGDMKHLLKVAPYGCGDRVEIRRLPLSFEDTIRRTLRVLSSAPDDANRMLAAWSRPLVNREVTSAARSDPFILASIEPAIAPTTFVDFLNKHSVGKAHEVLRAVGLWRNGRIPDAYRTVTQNTIRSLSCQARKRDLEALLGVSDQR